MKRSNRRCFFVETFCCLVTALLPTVGNAEENAFDLALKAQDHISEKRFQQAVDVLEKAVQKDASNEWIWGLLGRAKAGIEDYAGAVTAFRRVLQINPRDTYSRMMVDRLVQHPIERDYKGESIYRENDDKSALKRSVYNIKRIVLDPGHGGFDPGAVGQNGTQEKDVVLDIALRTASELKKAGYAVFLTRSEDYYVTLRERSAFATMVSADLFVSIHANAAENTTAHGIETFFCSDEASSKYAKKIAEYENSFFSKEEKYAGQEFNLDDILFRFERKRYWNFSKVVANTVQENIVQRIKRNNRGVKSAKFSVLEKARMPSILIECGFISNTTEERMLLDDNYIRLLSESILESLKEVNSA